MSSIESNQPGEGDLPIIPKDYDFRFSSSRCHSVLKAYAEQVKEERGNLFMDARKSGNEEFAKAHLKRYQAAYYIELECQNLMQWYRDSK